MRRSGIVESQLRAIVGFELEITHLEGKHKVSQNRAAEDVAGVIKGLGDDGELAMQALVQRAISEKSSEHSKGKAGKDWCFLARDLDTSAPDLIG